MYFEDIYTFPIEMRHKKDRQERKRKRLDIGQRLQEEREQELWDRKEERLALGKKIRPRTGNDSQVDAAGGDGKIGMGNFDYMNIDELKQHENGILNLFEGERNIAKYVSHNQAASVKGNGPPAPGTKGAKNYVRLSQYEYETIFEKDPSFNEKRAFVEVFRKKWKEDKGYCSMFDKRGKYRKAKSAALGKGVRLENAQKWKQKQERQMLLNYEKKLAHKEEEMERK